jgi:hypothetical protein
LLYEARQASANPDLRTSWRQGCYLAHRQRLARPRQYRQDGPVKGGRHGPSRITKVHDQKVYDAI